MLEFQVEKCRAPRAQGMLFAVIFLSLVACTRHMRPVCHVKMSLAHILAHSLRRVSWDLEKCWMVTYQTNIHPGRLTWNLQITHLERKMIFQTPMIMFYVNLPGCNTGNAVLVGGWTNPFETYARQIGFIFPNFRSEHKKYLSCHHLVYIYIKI